MKNTLLAIENIIISILLLSFVFLGPLHTMPLFPFSSFLKNQAPSEVFLILAIMNVFLATQFFHPKKKGFPFLRYAILTQLSLLIFGFYYLVLVPNMV